MTSYILPNPYGVPFERFASVLVEQLSLYNVAQSPTVDNWKDWAAAILREPSMELQGLPDPRYFPTWQSWAARVHERLL